MCGPSSLSTSRATSAGCRAASSIAALPPIDEPSTATGAPRCSISWRSSSTQVSRRYSRLSASQPEAPRPGQSTQTTRTPARARSAARKAKRIAVLATPPPHSSTGASRGPQSVTATGTVYGRRRRDGTPRCSASGWW
jgi:hypothetical protein